MKNYVKLGDLAVYRLALDLSNYSWPIFNRLTWQNKKIIGDQFIRAIDSIGANVAEGYGRFHYLDRIKFYYNSRGSLLESKHWALLLKNRSKITNEEFKILIEKLNYLHKTLNQYISSCYPKK